jgi:DNA-binding NarL/FixJ family response regulator
MSTEDRGGPIAICGRRCVIVDDNERFLSVAQDHLTNEGLAIVGTATSRTEALQQAEALRPDIVLVDISLGTDSGFEVTRCLVENFPELYGRVVLISSRSEEDFADLIGDSPAVGFLPKNLLSARAISDLLDADGC